MSIRASAFRRIHSWRISGPAAVAPGDKWSTGTHPPTTRKEAVIAAGGQHKGNPVPGTYTVAPLQTLSPFAGRHLRSAVGNNTPVVQQGAGPLGLVLHANQNFGHAFSRRGPAGLPAQLGALGPSIDSPARSPGRWQESSSDGSRGVASISASSGRSTSNALSAGNSSKTLKTVEAGLSSELSRRTSIGQNTLPATARTYHPKTGPPLLQPATSLALSRPVTLFGSAV